MTAANLLDNVRSNNWNDRTLPDKVQQHERINITDKDPIKRITNILISAGLDPSMIGFKYTRDAIIMIMDDPELSGVFTKVVYRKLARKYTTTGPAIEHAIRRCICPINTVNRHFSNKKFIISIVNCISVLDENYK